MSTPPVLDEPAISCDDGDASDAFESSRVLIDGGEFAIEPEDLFKLF
jgi:hypothetical protein